MGWVLRLVESGTDTRAGSAHCLASNVTQLRWLPHLGCYPAGGIPGVADGEAGQHGNADRAVANDRGAIPDRETGRVGANPR